MSFTSMPSYVLFALGVLLVFNIGVTWALARDYGVTLPQKLGQTLVIWLLPVVGGVLILSLVGSHHTRAEMKSMVPFPFYLAAPKPYEENKNRDNLGSGDYPAERSDAEGVCGSD